MENENKLNDIPESDLNSVNGGNGGWKPGYSVNQQVRVRYQDSWVRLARITILMDGWNVCQVEFLDGRDPKRANIQLSQILR